MNIFKKIHDENHQTRQRIAIGVAFVLTIAILAIWLVSLSGRFKESQDQVPKTAQPFSLFGQTFSKIFGEARDVGESVNVFDQEGVLRSNREQSLEELKEELSEIEDFPEEFGDVSDPRSTTFENDVVIIMDESDDRDVGDDLQ